MLKAFLFFALEWLFFEMFLAAAEEHIEHLKNVNNRLHEKIDELTNQIASDRHAFSK